MEKQLFLNTISEMVKTMSEQDLKRVKTIQGTTKQDNQMIKNWQQALRMKKGKLDINDYRYHYKMDLLTKCIDLIERVIFPTLEIGHIIMPISETWGLKSGKKYKLVKMVRNRLGGQMYIFKLNRKNATTEIGVYITDLENCGLRYDLPTSILECALNIGDNIIVLNRVIV